jgi:hypothetical protein
MPVLRTDVIRMKQDLWDSEPFVVHCEYLVRVVHNVLWLSEATFAVRGEIWQDVFLHDWISLRICAVSSCQRKLVEKSISTH